MSIQEIARVQRVCIIVLFLLIPVTSWMVSVNEYERGYKACVGALVRGLIKGQDI